MPVCVLLRAACLLKICICMISPLTEEAKIGRLLIKTRDKVTYAEFALPILSENKSLLCQNFSDLLM